MRRPTLTAGSLLLVLLVLLGGCIEISELFPYRLANDDDSSAGDDDDDDSGDDDDSSADDDDDSGDDDDDGTPCDTSWLVPGLDPVSLAFEVEPLFSSNCDPCHTVQELGGLRLSPGMSFEALVGVPNVLAWDTDMPRVTPFEPQASYLMHKLVGCDPADKDWGHYQSTMPPPIGETIPLTTEETLVIYTWIVQGAEDN